MARIVDPTGREILVIEQLVDLSGSRVVDIGCGDGRTTFRVAQKAASVVGIDPDTEAIERAQQAIPDGDHHRISFVAADVSTLSLPAGTFDAAIFSRSL